MRIIEGIYWGIMWEVHLTHQVATIIFLYFFYFLVLASHWQREREMGNIPGVSYRRRVVSERVYSCFIDKVDLEERAPGTVQEINTLGEFYFKVTFSQTLFQLRSLRLKSINVLI